jgi:predicted enzyme related to lactoylglutathione lyase
MDMGPMGTYLLFNYGSGDGVGGIMNDAGAPRPYWLYYFNVDNIDAAHGRVKANAGAAPDDPHQVPGGAWIVHARDPQGARFALVGPRR